MDLLFFLGALGAIGWATYRVRKRTKRQVRFYESD